MRFLLAFLAVLVPGDLFAETRITVRAGDHPEFTRVTFSTEPGLEWLSDGRSLSFSTENVIFDTSSLFSRIGRSRLQSLGIDGAKATFILSCDCNVSVFQAAPDLVAADIRGAGMKANLSDTDDSQPNLILPLLSTSGSIDHEDSPFPVPILEDARSESGNHQSSVRSDNIVWSISRAATLGLIEPIQSTDSRSEINPSETVELGAHWQAHTRIATDRSEATEVSEQQDISCPAPSSLPQLSQSKEVTHAQLLEALTNEVGRLEVDRVIDLIDFYISSAQGAEATSLMPLVEGGKVDLAIRKTIARFLDKGPDENRHVFGLPHLFCGSETALWAFVFLHEETRSDALDYRVLIDEFLAWPEPLQSRIAPELIGAMLDRNRPDLARILARTSDTKHLGEKSLINNARLADSADSASQPTEFFGQIFSGQALGSPEDLAEQIEFALESGHKFTEDELERGVALLPEYKGMNGESQLRMALSSAYIQNGNFSAAFNLWEPEGRSQALEHLFWQALDHIAFEEIAWAALATLETDSENFSEELQKRLSAELIQIGFLPRPINRHLVENEGSPKPANVHDVTHNFGEPVSAAVAEDIANKAAVVALDVEGLLQPSSREN